MNYYARLVIVIVIIVGLSQFMPEVINSFLVLILLSMVILQADQFSRLLAGLNLK